MAVLESNIVSEKPSEEDLNTKEDESQPLENLVDDICLATHGRHLSFQELLTDSRKNEIKRQIGVAFLDILK